jgi:ankyrin repeat protein
VELLLSKGADVNTESGFYDEALQAASKQDHDKMAKLLLSKGANADTITF